MNDEPSWTARFRRVLAPTTGTASKQLYFAALMAGFTLLVMFSRHELVLTPPYLLAIGILLVATVLALTVRWEEITPSWGVLVPVLDIVAVALVRDLLRESSMAVSLLVLIPVLWMAARLRLAGVAISVLSVAMLITVPALRRATEIDSLTIANSMLLPLIVLQVGLLVVGALKLLDGHHRQLAATLAEKEALLEAAAASEQLLKNIIDSVDVGIVVVDSEGHDVLMNRAQQRIHLLATPPEERDPHEAQLLLRYPGTTRPIPPAQRPVRRAVLQETYSNYIVDAGPPGNGAVSYSASARQILDRHGVRSGAVVVFSDVTSYIETVRSQERFVAAVSHELRTPLTSVIGYLDLAREDPALPERLDKHLGIATRNAEQLLLIVQDLLVDQVARSGTEQLTLRPHTLSEIARHATESFALRAVEQGISLEAEVSETPELPLDGTRLRQAVANLLSNALKYTPRGGTVQVSTGVHDNHAELSVLDTGIGISDKEQTNLFSEYYRTESARHSAIAGHGIGLALTRRIVVAHGGQISVRSTPGEGSRFTLRFPLERADGNRPADEADVGRRRPDERE